MAEATNNDQKDADVIPDSSELHVKKSRVKKSEALWLTSFSDLSILLMCFFVMQLSYSTPDKRKYEQVKNAMQTLSAKKEMKDADNLDTLSQKIEKVIKQRKLDKTVSVTYDMNGLSIEFKDAMLFATASSDLDPKYAKIVDQVMQAIAGAPGDYRLIFEGHTDDVPMTSGKFKSNWELSSARGVALLDSFKRRGVAESRMSVQSYAHTRPKMDISGLKGKELAAARAANRRVVIKIE